MASRVNICLVNILDNPSMFTDKFKLEITFEVYENLPHDLEWELVYVGSGTSSEFDQVLDSVLVGPVPEGRHKFVFDAAHPDVSKIPADDIVGVSVLLLRCKYNEQEFINLGWFVSNEYTDEALKENPPSQPQVDKLARKVETEDLRVTTFPIKWNEEEAANEFPEADGGDRVFAEEELMPMNDDNVAEEDDEEDDDDEDDNNASDVDLNESFEKVNKRLSSALDSIETADTPMEDDSGDAAHSVQISNEEKMDQAANDPFVDKTNEAMA